ncbi:hypothetical protein GGR54DRAFT_628424 [Hypoxylon sp. NC1633]|nr:hypothetical protein GGR54DRAFT_628424 [Hypoxylon sp. NC1633]
MAKQIYEVFFREDITDDMLAHAAKLFTKNYGIWGDQPSCTNIRHSLVGKHAALNVPRLRDHCLPDNADILYARVTVDGTLAGNAFACRWPWNGKRICWITQLVVDQRFRDRGFAKGLLGVLRVEGNDVYGIMSSHPFACQAAAKTFAGSIEKVSLDFIASNAESIMKASPISYVRDAKLCGSIFDAKDSTGLVSGADSNFFIDHREPLEALRVVREVWNWPLGELLDGHEYVLIMQAIHRRSHFIPKSIDKK